MSLERRRETKRTEKKEDLKDSSFRKNDFTPLSQKRRNEEITPAAEEFYDLEIVDELNEIEIDVLDIAKDILKLKRYVFITG